MTEMARSPSPVKLDEFYSRPHQDVPVYKPTPKLEHEMLRLPLPGGDGIGSRLSRGFVLSERPESRVVSSICDTRAIRGNTEYEGHGDSRSRADGKMGNISSRVEVTAGFNQSETRSNDDSALCSWSAATTSFNETMEQVSTALISMVGYMCLLYLGLVVMVTICNKTIVFKPFFLDE